MAQKKDFTDTFLKTQKEKLLKCKQEILSGLRERSTEELATSSDDLPEEGDLSNAIMIQNYAIGLRERDIQRLREIDLALQKIDSGTYGYCEESGDPIELKRLEKLPWARLSLYYAELEERETVQRKVG